MYASRQAQLQQVHNLIGSLLFTLPEAQQKPGIFWCELYVSFAGRGGRCGKTEEHDCKTNAKTMTGFREGLMQFKAFVRYVVANCIREEDRCFPGSENKDTEISPLVLCE